MKATKHAIIFFIIVFSIAAVVASFQFRQYPSHMIVKQVNCFSCHIDEFEDLKYGDHIRMMDRTQNRTLYDYIGLYGNNDTISNTTRALEGSCYSCHITYAKYYQFGLTDPFAYVTGKKTYILDNLTNTINLTDSQYGYIIKWPAGNRSTTYFNGTNASLHIELEVLDVSPVNSSVESTVKVIFANYSGQQIGNISCNCTEVNGTMILNFANIAEDYFKIIVVLDGTWNNTLVNLRVNGTDKGSESFFITANTQPFVYELPLSATGVYYFKTNGTYKAVRLDYVMGEWINYTMENITTSDIIETNSSNGWIGANTCSSPNAMCHINQRVTYMGLSNGMNQDKSFYTHQMEFTTSKQCDICHLNNKILVKVDR